jgi:hypothetical protein
MVIQRQQQQQMMMDALSCHFMVVAHCIMSHGRCPALCCIVIIQHCVVLSSSTITLCCPLSCVLAVERDMGGVVVVVIAAVDSDNGVLRHQ